jgi:hypothetical protein
MGAERKIGNDWMLSGDFVYWRVYHEWIRQDCRSKVRMSY